MLIVLSGFFGHMVPFFLDFLVLVVVVLWVFIYQCDLVSGPFQGLIDA